MRLSQIGHALLKGMSYAKRIAKDNDCKQSWLRIYCHMIILGIKYDMNAWEYTQKGMYKLKGDDLVYACEEFDRINKSRKLWRKLYRSNWRFLARWTKEKYSGRSCLSKMRAKAYVKHYHLSNLPIIQYGVHIICEHHHIGRLAIGKDVLLARDADLDYTGDLIIEDGVAISEGVKILTHNHDLYPKGTVDNPEECIPTPLTLRDHAWLGAKVSVLPGVGEIGRSAIIGVGSVVRNRIPPYAIVMGNPAKIVGFVFTPDEMVEYEESRYSDDNKTDRLKYQLMYDKYFINRNQYIKDLLKY